MDSPDKSTGIDEATPKEAINDNKGVSLKRGSNAKAIVEAAGKISNMLNPQKQSQSIKLDAKDEGGAAQKQPPTDEGEGKGEEDTEKDNDPSSDKEEYDFDYKLKVRVDGKKQEVTLKDLIDNYSGKVAYDKKFQDLSIEKKQINQTREDFEQQKSLAIQQVLAPVLQKEYDKIALIEADISVLENSNLKEFTYSEEKTNGDLLKDKILELTIVQRNANRVANEVLQSRKTIEAKSQEQLLSTLQEQLKILEDKNPKYKDPSEIMSLRNRMVSDLGFSEEFALKRHWMADDVFMAENLLEMQDKAKKWDALQNKKPKIDEEVRKKPNFVKSGTSRSEATVKKEQRDAFLKAHKEDNSLKSAAKALRGFI